MGKVLDVADLIVRDVAEIPDRTSPDEYPDMMLVTPNELREIIRKRLEYVGVLSKYEVFYKAWKACNALPWYKDGRNAAERDAADEALDTAIDALEASLKCENGEAR